MRGEGPIANLVAQQYEKWTRRYGLNQQRWEPDCTRFSRPGRQLGLF